MDDKEAELPCSGKLAFSTAKEAQATATVAKHRYGSHVKPYKCHDCKLWHLATA